MSSADPTPAETMTVVAARQLADGDVCLVGIGLPSLAANLARRLHAPRCVLIYESGTIGAKPAAPPLSIGDGELAATADTVVSVPEIFNYWLQAGRVDVGFLGAAQIDRRAHLNTTVRVVVVLRHSRRAFVDRLDFRTSVPGPGPTVVITDLGTLERVAGGHELVLTALHPGVTVDDVRAATGWDLPVADDLARTEAPSDVELAALRALEAAMPA
jgi:glutaconate CoA-transferase subunit B